MGVGGVVVGVAEGVALGAVCQSVLVEVVVGLWVVVVVLRWRGWECGSSGNGRMWVLVEVAPLGALKRSEAAIRADRYRRSQNEVA